MLMKNLVEVAEPSATSKTTGEVGNTQKLAEEVAKLENEKFFLTTQLELTRFAFPFNCFRSSFRLIYFKAF